MSSSAYATYGLLQQQTQVGMSRQCCAVSLLRTTKILDRLIFTSLLFKRAMNTKRGDS